MTLGAFLAPVLLTCICVAAAAGADRPAEYILSAMRSERERLASGVVRVEGHFRQRDNNGKEYVLKWSAFMAFDRARGLERIDQDLPVLFHDGTTQPNKMKHVRTPDRCFEWLHGPYGVGLFIRPLDYNGHSHLRRIDLWTIGLVGTHSLTIPVSLDALMTVLAEEPFAVEQLGGGLLQLQYLMPESQIYSELILNESEGITPIQYSHRSVEAGSQLTGMPKARWPKPLFQADTTWMERNGVWVPKTLVITEENRGCDLHFEWVEVNTEIDTQLFTEEGMGLNPGTMVQDLRLGKPIVLGMLVEVLDKKYREEHRVVSRQREYWRYVVIGLAVLAVPLVGFWWWRRTR